MPDDYVAVLVNQAFYPFQVARLYSVLLVKGELAAVPYVFCVSAFAYHMYVHRFMVAAEKHE